MSNALINYVEKSFGNTLDADEFHANLELLGFEHQQAQKGRSNLTQVVQHTRAFHNPSQAPTIEAARNTVRLRSDLLNVFFAPNSQFPIQRLKQEGLDVTVIGSGAFSEIVSGQSDLDIIFATPDRPMPHHQALIREITPAFSNVAQKNELTLQDSKDTSNFPPFTPSNLHRLANKLKPLNVNRQPKNLLTDHDIDLVGDTANLITGLGLGPLAIQRQVGLGIMSSLSESTALKAFVTRSIEEEILSRRLKRRPQP